MKKRLISLIIIVLVLAALLLMDLSCGELDSAQKDPVAEPQPEINLPIPEAQQSPLPTPTITPTPPPPEPSPEIEEEPTEEPEPTREPLEAWPAWMYIPAINVDAEVQDTGTDYVVNSMAIVPSGSIISWWRESPIPGNEGNAIFGGHNKWGGALGQLYYLDEMEIGDEMEILYTDGTSLIYRLESVFVYALATAPANLIMDIEGDARVTIITCKEPYNPSIGTSDNRIIAIFKEESVFVIPDPPIEPFPPRETGD